MSNNLLTIRYLKKLTKGVISINKEYSEIDDNYIVMYDDIISEKFYPLFSDSENPKSMVNGLIVLENRNGYVRECDILLKYVKLDSTETSSDKVNLSPCGDKANISVIANYKKYERNSDGDTLLECLSSFVNPILRLSNPLFVLKGHSVEVGSNETDDILECIVTSSYAFKGCVKNSSIKLYHPLNSIGDWTFSSSTTDSIQVNSSKKILSRDGDSCSINVLREFTNHYFKEDSCGNKVDFKDEKDNTEDITLFCKISITNEDYFTKNVNKITVEKQELNSLERECTIIAEYENVVGSTLIKQESGYTSSYSYSLSFDNDDKFLYYEIPSSNTEYFYIPIKSTKNLIVNGEIVSSIESDELKFYKKDNWYDLSITNYDGKLSLKIIINENNTNINSSRESEFEVYNKNNIDTYIKCHISQPKNKCLETVYSTLICGSDTFTYESIKGSKIELKPYIKRFYEDGSSLVENKLDSEHEICCRYFSTDDSILRGSKPIQYDFNGNHYMIPICNDFDTPDDIYLTIYSWISDKIGNKVSDETEFKIRLLGKDRITYEYILSLENDDIYKELVWNFDSLSEIVLPIKSFRYKYVNGILSEKETCGFRVSSICDNFNTFIDENNNLHVSPRKVNNSNDDFLSNLYLLQENNENKIHLNLFQKQHPLKEYKNLSLTVSVHKDEIINDIWADYNSKLIVKKLSNDEIVKEIPLNKWWIYPTIKNNNDIIFNGNINLEIGERYKFIIHKLISNNLFNENINNVILNEDYIIEDDDEGIDLIIEI